MEWVDQGVVLSARRYGEGGAIASILTHGHGRHAGLVRGGGSKAQRGVLLPGNRVQVRWRARLDDHLGAFVCELLHADAANLLVDRDRLACLSAACAVAESGLPEREPCPEAYGRLLGLLDALARPEDDWAAVYVRWEVSLLAELGYGLELGYCAATGSNDQLIYVSPKSGQAVSASAGEPYRERLLPLPAFVVGEGGTCPADIAAGLRLTGHFLERHVFPMMPPARTRLADRFKHPSAITSPQVGRRASA